VQAPWAGFDVGVHATGAGVRPFPANSYRFLSNRRISPEKGRTDEAAEPGVAGQPDGQITSV